MLALIAPDPAIRREYLAAFFEGKEPGRTHEMLAGLAARGLARVFVTTNFDRLLEHALQARGIEPIVVASDADLQAAPPREHAHCVVLKPHGDYLRQTIRNTPEELEELEPAMTAELAEVFNRYGIVVVGYSG
ncbi:MAG: SIR2 family protein [Solirubrobacteraceae bacterium]